MKHFVSIITNLTSGKIEEFSEKIDPGRVPSIVASLHIKELKRLNLVDRYVSNYGFLKKKGFSISAFAVAYPSLLAEAGKYREFYAGLGVEFEYSLFFGEYNGKEYPLAYTDEELDAFRMKKTDRNRFCQSGNLCNAGYNAAVVTFNGDVFPCNRMMGARQKMGNIYSGIRFASSLKVCRYDSCGCPLSIYDSYLFEKAVEAQKKGLTGSAS